MWIFMNDAFVSIVQERGEPDKLRVRARIKGDIERALPDAVGDVFEPKRSDYRYHAVLPRDYVVAMVASRLSDVDYPDFKSSVPDKARKCSYSDVWGVMHRAQEAAT